MRYNTRNLPLGSLRALQLFVLMDHAFFQYYSKQTAV